MKKDELMMKLNSKFQRQIFQRLVSKYRGSINASKYLNIPASSIRSYKNLYFKSVPKNLIDRLAILKIIDLNELTENVLSSFNKKDLINTNLNLGRKKRNDQLKKFKASIPKLKGIINNHCLDVSRWLNKYLFLLNSGFRKVTLIENRNYFILKYSNFAKTTYKDFETKLPKKIKLDNEFLYFFGLWCGDRAGGKRFGVCNKNKKIINFTENFLVKHYQKVEKILYMANSVQEPDIKYDKKFVINKEWKGWVLSVHSNNGVFSSFFHYLHSNLYDFLFKIDNKRPFFAGLFDAEGNVSLYNKSFRWACKNENLVKIYSKFLKELNLFDRYDGNCLVSYNMGDFYKKILPYMIHSEKINQIKLLCKGTGELNKEHLEILDFLRCYPNKTSKDIAKALKKKKVYSELRLLSQFGFICQNKYPYQYKINNKGLKSLGV